MQHLTQYKDTLAGKGSQLAAAIAESPEAAKKVYDATTARFDAMYPGAKDDRIWFNTQAKRDGWSTSKFCPNN